MAFKFLTFACLVAVARAGVIAPVAHYAAAPVAHYAAPVAHYAAPAKIAYAAPVAHYAPAKVAYAAPEEQYAPAEYSFEYSVHDEHTGDIKSQQETRHGDQVQGSYSLIEADGSKRIVEYTADEHSGFNAVVHREPAAHPVAVKPVLKVAAPVAVHGYAAPAPAYHSYSAPAPAYHSYAAPVQSYYHH